MAETSWSGPENMHSLVSIICFQLITFLRIYLTSLQLCEWDCVEAVDRFLSFGIIGFIVGFMYMVYFSCTWVSRYVNN